MLFCTIIAVVMSNPIRKITLNMLCSVPCCDVQQIFFSSFLSKGHSQLSKHLFRNKLALKILLDSSQLSPAHAPITLLKIISEIQKKNTYYPFGPTYYPPIISTQKCVETRFYKHPHDCTLNVRQHNNINIDTTMLFRAVQ